MKIYMDEAGRGPLAWPLFVWLVIKKEELDFQRQYPLFQDSKKLSASQRALAYDQIQALAKKRKILITTQKVSAKVIDAYGLTRGISLAIAKGLYSFFSDYFPQEQSSDQNYKHLSYLISRYGEEQHQDVEIIIDGKHDFWLSKELGLITLPQVHGDARYPEIAMASILAKVERDSWMQKLESLYPGYGFAKHKGYGTKAHYQQIQQLGICPEHRKLFLKKMIPDWQITSFDRDIPFPRD